MLYDFIKLFAIIVKSDLWSKSEIVDRLKSNENFNKKWRKYYNKTKPSTKGKSFIWVLVLTNLHMYRNKSWNSSFTKQGIWIGNCVNTKLWKHIPNKYWDIKIPQNLQKVQLDSICGCATNPCSKYIISTKHAVSLIPILCTIIKNGLGITTH